VDEALCVGCGVCTTKCKFDAISLIRVYDGEGVALENMKPVVIKQMLTRKVRIAGKKVSRSVASIFKN
jgi:ferredoxin